MTTTDKRMHLTCKDCSTEFSTGEVFPMGTKKLAKLVRETKCPKCGAGSKSLLLRFGEKK